MNAQACEMMGFIDGNPKPVFRIPRLVFCPLSGTAFPKTVDLILPSRLAQVSGCRWECYIKVSTRSRTYRIARLISSDSSTRYYQSFLKWPGGVELSDYSRLRAITGSTWVARRAGTKQAPRATPNSVSGTAANVIGSVALTP